MKKQRFFGNTKKKLRKNDKEKTPKNRTLQNHINTVFQWSFQIFQKIVFS